MTALIRVAPRRSERNHGGDNFTWRVVGERQTLLEIRGRAGSDKLSRYVFRGGIAASLMIGVVLALLARPRGMTGCSTTPTKATQIKISQLLHEALPMFLAHHPERDCPSLGELTTEMNSRDIDDAWGTPIEMFCARGPRLAVWLRSAGPDRKLGSYDDLEDSLLPSY